MMLDTTDTLVVPTFDDVLEGVDMAALAELDAQMEADERSPDDPEG